TKKSETISMRDKSISFLDELIQSFQKSRQLKEQLNFLDQIVKNSVNETGKETELQPVASQVEEIASRNLRLNPSLALELIISRDELCAAIPSLTKGSPALSDLLREHENRLAEIVTQVASNKQKRVLAEMPQAFPTDWVTRLLAVSQTAGFRVVGEIARIFVE